MKHYASARFWQCFNALPSDVQNLARRCYVLINQDPAHPSLQFKPVSHGRYRSVRVGIHYRALGIPVADGVVWFWIGTHSNYDKLLA